MSTDNDHIRWFRNSSPYINAHRAKTFVIYLGGEAIDHENFSNVINDIALLNSLGVKLIIVHGAAPQITQSLTEQQLQWPMSGNIPVTTPKILAKILAPIVTTRTRIEASLSKGHASIHTQMLVTGGNFVTAKPIGIMDGTDFHHTGTTRRVNRAAIINQLEHQAIVVISPIGHSPSGETFILDPRQLAHDVGRTIGAEKLIYFSPDDGIRDHDGLLINEITEANDLSFHDPDNQTLAKLAIAACLNGVKRCHVINYKNDGALLEELFTRDGSGTQIIKESYEKLRTASPDDVAGIIELISPLEHEGILVKRSRELIESELDHFRIIERDGMIVACAALYPFESQGELACLATHPEYRNDNRGELLLQSIESSAKDLGLTSLFVLTTQAVHWFIERGFEEHPIDTLPEERFYNLQRNSKYLQKTF
jgi:amino-acid N-acetyltransferase